MYSEKKYKNRNQYALDQSLRSDTGVADSRLVDRRPAAAGQSQLRLLADARYENESNSKFPALVVEQKNELINPKSIVTSATRNSPIQLRPVVINLTFYYTAENLAGTRYRLVRRRNSQERLINDTNSNTILSPRLSERDAQAMSAHIASLLGSGVSNLDSLVLGIEHAEALGIPNTISIARLGLILRNIQNVIRIRIRADHAQIVGMFPVGTIDAVHQNAIESIEIPGSDPHKGGQVVAFINYHNLLLPGATVRLVYKPGDLGFDKLIYDSVGSVAVTLGGSLASYSIVPQGPDALAVANPKLQNYGYMEYVPNGCPITAADLGSVYRSLGANLAVAYVFGLRDIHHENFILLQDRIQFIDMEAGTSTYTSFNAMELLSLPRVLRDQLARSFMVLDNNTLGGLSTDATLILNLRNGFSATLASMQTGGPNDAAMAAAVYNTTQKETRFVPFSTANLQMLAGRFHGKLGSALPAPFPLTAPLVADENAFVLLTDNVATQCAAGAGNDPRLLGQFRRMLRSAACRKALNVGDVPYWTRRGRSIFSEDHTRIVRRLRHNRLNDSSQNEIDANNRRAPANAAQALLDFDNQVVNPMFGTPMADLVLEHRRLRNGRGYGPPNY